jgi:small subunit ribosomal protein S5
MPETDFEEKMILVRRTARMQAGGRRFKFGALVVVGDRQGRVGLGLGKAPEVPLAVQKANYYARRNMVEVPLVNGTIPHEIEVEYGASKILLKPAAPGTGVIAGAVPRAILELAGITDILTKELGSRNPINIAYATMEAAPDLGRRQAAQKGERVMRLKVKLVKSPIGYPKDQKAALKALGLTRLNRERVFEDRPEIRGQLEKVKHLVKVEVAE